jgi:cobalt-zinc-cadmium efflux system membrane fusion protein
MALVLLLLGGLACWGHYTGWSFSAPAGPDPGAPDWCGLHGVPESVCVECNPGLLPRPPAFGWCARHGVHQCPLCHPELAQTAKPPTVTQADLDRARRALNLRPRPENDPACLSGRRRIQFASEEVVTRAGIDITPVWEAAMTEAVNASGESGYDPTRVASLSARVTGSVWQVVRKVGDQVRQGDVLALLEAPEVGKAKAEVQQALVQARLKGKAVANMRQAAGSVPERLLREGEAALRQAEVNLLQAEQTLVNLGLPLQARDLQELGQEQVARRLQFLGLAEAVARTLDPRTTTANLIPVLAPLDGTVTACEVVAGEVTDPAKVLFVVTDASRLWLTLHVAVDDVGLLRPGLPVRFRPDGSKEQAQGTLGWIGTSTDEKTRTVPVRADLTNPLTRPSPPEGGEGRVRGEGRLRAHTFGVGQIILREEPKAIVVPNEAVQAHAGCQFVFVRDRDYLKPDAPKVFHARTVRTGARDDQNTEIIVGVLPGEVVVTRGSGLLLKELSKNQPGAMHR